MSSFWNILGLDGPTSDLKAIRRAYAKALRIARPDDDPEGFMALREAFERAKTYASYHAYDAPEPDSVKPAEDPPSLTIPNNTDDDRLGPDLTPDTDDDNDVAPITTSDYLPDDLEPALPVLPPIEITQPPEPQEPSAAVSEPIEPLPYAVIDDAASLLASPRRNSEREWDKVLSRAHELSLDEYNIFDHRFRSQLLEHFSYYDGPTEPPKGLKKILTKTKPKPKIDKDTGIFIFKTLGWNRWKGYPDYVQTELLYLLYELGIKDRPKVEETGKAAIFSELRYVLKVFGIAVIFALLGNFTEPQEDTSPPPEPLPSAGTVQYGEYSFSEDTREWQYKLNRKNEGVKNLKPGDTLSDRFELQISDTEIMTVFITINGGEIDPTIDNITTTRPIKKDPPSGIHSFFFFIAGLAGIYAAFRFFSFGIGLIIGFIGLLLGHIRDTLRAIFNR